MADKPDKFPDWATEEQADPVSGQLNRVEPPEFRKETGWQRREIPPRQWFNWQAWLTGKWIRWIVPILEGLGSMATRNAGTGSSQFRTNSQNDDRYNHRSNNLSDVADADEARANLGISDLILQEVVSTSSTNSSTTSPFFQDTSLSATITPTQTGSVIEVIAVVPVAQAIQISGDSTNRAADFLIRNETDGVDGSEHTFGRFLATSSPSSAGSRFSPVVVGRFTVISTSSKTFRLRFRRAGAGDGSSVAMIVNENPALMILREIRQ